MQPTPCRYNTEASVWRPPSALLTAAENGDGSRRTLVFSAQRRMEYDGMVLPYGCKRLTNSTQALRRQNHDNLRPLRQ